MSVDISQCIKSKYFECSTGMDESLSDFQENKQNHKGPKVGQKVTKQKIKKAIKRIKGQKDIRAVLKKSKNDLISYSKEFDNVCKKSGLDVDSEHLQLAIALSKSLQTDSEPSSSQPLTAKGRLAKIRTTLQEYGFKVPAAKISNNKKIKKNRNVYKLIATTVNERHQKVSNKYAKVLLSSFDVPNITEHNHNNEFKAPIFHLASNLSYESMRDNNIFYVENLIEKSTNSGYMLRDWAEIPGRPVSPILHDNSTIDIKEMAYSQNELDVILSSSIKSAKNFVMKRKSTMKRKANDVIENADNIERDVGDCTENNEETNFRDSPKIKQDVIEIISTNKINILDLESTSSINNDVNRCGSPDLFEDDVSCTIPLFITPTKCLSQGQKTKIFTESINCMDLTGCANNSYHVEKTLFPSQDKTKRKSNDFMDLTQCAVSASQVIQKEIDLTPDESTKLEAIILPDDTNSPINDSSNKTLVLDNQNNKSQTNSYNELTPNIIKDDKIDRFDERKQISIYVNDENNKIEDINKTPLANDTIDLTQSYKEESVKNSEELECMDLTQSSKSSTCLDDLPEIELNNIKIHSYADDTIILKEEEYISINTAKKAIVEDEQLDLIDDESEQYKEKKYESFYDDFIHEYSDSKENDSDIVHNRSEDVIFIDAVQSPYMTDRPISDEDINKTTSGSLGKKDDISIDYDDFSEYNNKSKAEGLNKENSLDTQICNNRNNNFNELNSSQQSEDFDLTDKELDYSMHKSKYDNYEDCNYDFSDISMVDSNNTGVNTEIYLKKRNAAKSISPISETPEIKLMNSIELNDNNLDTFSPNKIKVDRKGNVNIGSLRTPNNSEYIVKTNEVTPMLDYESMTTPQRNKELDKYGLRPFKRKRAIQILTHLYNQTHPVIESYLDSDQASPSKKSKLENEPSCSSPINLRTLISPKKIQCLSSSPRKPTSPNKPVISESNTSPRKSNKKSKSPRKFCGNRKENSPRRNVGSIENVVCTYNISSEVPVIKNLDCNPDDWVFQKKEKAKVHSCRVPLHIAFYNYVSSRRSLREAILKYEPVNIDIIHKDLVSYGHRYDPKDLLRFLDKKCITVKTADNNARNKR